MVQAFKLLKEGKLLPFRIKESVQKTIADLGEYAGDYNDLDILHQFLLVQDEQNGKWTLESVFDPPGDKKNLENRQLV